MQEWTSEAIIIRINTLEFWGYNGKIGLNNFIWLVTIGKVPEKSGEPYLFISLKNFKVIGAKSIHFAIATYRIYPFHSVLRIAPFIMTL